MKSTLFPPLAQRLALSLLAILAAPSVQAVDAAKVNGKVITVEELNRKFPLLAPLYQNKIATKQDVLDDLIKRELGIQEAKKQGLDKDPEVVEEMNTVLYQALLRKNLTKEFDKIIISDKEAQNWYEKNPEIRTSHIFVAVAPNASKSDEQNAFSKIKSIQDKELKAGKSFAEVAQRLSEGVAAPMGGDIDYNMKDRLDPAYYAAATKLKVGGTSGIVRSQFGYHIIRLTAVRPWTETNRSAVKNLIYAERKQSVFERYMTGLRSKAVIQVNSQALN